MSKPEASQGPPAAAWVATTPSKSARKHKGLQLAAITVKGHGS